MPTPRKSGSVVDTETVTVTQNNAEEIAEVETETVDVEAVLGEEITDKLIEEATTFASLSLTNVKLFQAQCDLLEPFRPTLVKVAKEKAALIMVAKQKARIVTQMIPKDERPEEIKETAMELMEEFLLCLNRGNEIAKLIIPTKTVNSQGGGGEKNRRKVELEINGETVSLIAEKKLGKKESDQ